MTLGSRTRSIPLPMNCRSLAGLTRSNFCKARNDQPSLTLALMPRAHSRNRTARPERLSRWAILSTGSYPAQFNNLSSSSSVQGRQEIPRRSDFAPFAPHQPCGWRPGVASFPVLRKWRIRCQQSPRVTPGTSRRILLIALCLQSGPTLIPSIRRRSIAATRAEPISLHVCFLARASGMTHFQ